jgi:hypothetical protein
MLPMNQDQVAAIIEQLQAMQSAGIAHELVSSVAGGLIAAIAALMATKLSAWFAKKDIEHFTFVALVAEILQIRERLNAFLSRDNPYNYTTVPFLASPERACPVYMTSGGHVGSLKIRTVAPIVKFYGALLTVRARKVEPPAPDVFLSDDLRSVLADADACLAVLREEYR